MCMAMDFSHFMVIRRLNNISLLLILPLILLYDNLSNKLFDLILVIYCETAIDSGTR